jgi:hypothetical protein
MGPMVTFTVILGLPIRVRLLYECFSEMPYAVEKVFGSAS